MDRARPQSSPQQTQRRSSDEVIIPQIAMLVDREVIEKLPPQYSEFLTSLFGSSIFIDFCKMQIQSVEDKIKAISPMDFSMENYTKLSQDMRLLWRFWTDLLRYAEEFKLN